MVIPSRAESLPYVILEAAAAAQPLISTDVGGIGEIYGPNHRQRLIPADDPAILAGAIRAMLETPGPERLAQAADLAGHVRQNFRLDDMVDGVIAGWATSRANEEGNPFDVLLAEPLTVDTKGTVELYEIRPASSTCLLHELAR